MASGSIVLDSLREMIGAMPIIDTHEHIMSEDAWLAQPDGALDFTHFFRHYASVDILSAGCPADDWARITSEDTSLEDKWALFEPYWNRTKYTSYCRAVETAIRDLFGLPGLSRETYRELSAELIAARRPGWYRTVLKDSARIEISVNDMGTDSVDGQFFVPVSRLDDFVMAGSPEALRKCEERSGGSIHSVDDLVEAMRAVLSGEIEKGIVAVKSALAYVRTLSFGNASKIEAETAFDRISEGNDSKPLQDYLMHRLLEMTFDAGLPMQIHTGIQEGNGNVLDNSNPLHLNNLFLTYPSGRFDIFHAGYPFTGELAVMAKMFPGVHADLCWMNVVSPAVARRTLDEWIEVVPTNKILAFGGDYLFVEGAYAHSLIARDTVARVLAGKVAEGYMTLSEAEAVAKMLLHDNAKAFFGL